MVVTFNRRELLARCLDSVQNQKDIPFQVIVVDNASTDGTAEMLAAKYPEIKVIQNSRNLGFCAGNNRGICASTTPIVALLNNDAVADPLWLRVMHGALSTDGTIGMVACKILDIENPNRIDKVGHLIYWDGQNCGRGAGEIDRGQYDRMEEVLWPDGCAALYRKSALLEVGGFDEDFFAYADDADLGFRLRLAGYRAVLTPQAKVFHHRGSTLGRTNPFRVYLIERNRLLLVFKLFPLSLLVLNPFFYGLRLLRGLWAAMRGKGEAGRNTAGRGKLSLAMTLLRADWAAFRMLPKMLAKRRDIRRYKRLSAWQIFRLMYRYRVSLKTLMEGEP